MAKGDLISGASFPKELLDYLHSLGLPKHVIAFTLRCDGYDELVEISCTFHPEDSDGKILVDVQGRKKFNLVEVE